MEYELLSFVPIFPEVPKELFLDREKLSVEPLKIDIDMVERFELVLEPSEDWLKQISEVEEAYKKAHPNGNLNGWEMGICS